MGAARQPAQHIFGADDRQRKLFIVRLSVAAIIMPPGLHHLGAALHEQVDIGDMLDHFHRQHHVEALACVGQVLRGDGAIVDRAGRPARHARADLDIGLGRVGADDLRAEPRQRLGQDAAAAADIEDAQAREAADLLGFAPEMRRRPDRGYRRAAPD